MMNLMSIDYKNFVSSRDQITENMESPAVYIGLDNFQSIPKNRVALGINILTLIFVSLIFGILL